MENPTNHKLIAGNWKMNGSPDMTAEFEFAWDQMTTIPNVQFLICPPAHLLGCFRHIPTGGQDCSAHESGAYTGEISAPQLSEAGCTHCIVGHSERRQYHGETNTLVKDKAAQAIKAELTAIICVGETLEERENGQAIDVVVSQIQQSLPNDATAENCIIAYEPVWAIGTGKAATANDVKEMHAIIFDTLKSSLASGDKMRIIYGGSVKPENAKDLLNQDHVHGALIGGASLKTEDFIGIAKAV